MTISAKRGSGRPRKDSTPQAPPVRVDYTRRLQGPPSPQELHEIWGSLDEAMRQYLEILSAFWAPVEHDTVKACVAELQKYRLPGFKLKASSFLTVEMHAVQVGLAERDVQRLACTPALLDVATASALSAGRLGPIATWIRYMADSSGAHMRMLTGFGPRDGTSREAVGLATVARLALFEQDWSQLAEEVDSLAVRWEGTTPRDHPLWLLFHRPFAPDKFAPMPRELQTRILRHLDRVATQSFAPATEILDWIEAEGRAPGSADLDELRLLGVRRLLLDGDLARARKWLEGVSPGGPRGLADAALAFLGGDVPRALELFQVEFGKGGSMVGSALEVVAYIVARMRTVEDDDELQPLRRSLQSQQESCQELSLLVEMVETRLGMAHSPLRYFPGTRTPVAKVPPLATLLSDLLGLWKGKAWTLADVSALRGRRARVENAGMRTLVREYDHLLALVTGEDVAPDAVGCFVDAIPVPARWTGILDDLEKVTRELAQAREGTERLAWFLGPHPAHGDQVEVSAKLQKRTAKGAWSVGREASDTLLIDLHRHESPALSPADRKIVETVIPTCRSLGERSKVVPLLVGHPLVFWQGGKDPVEVVAARPAIRLVERHGRIRMSFDPEPPVSEVSYRVTTDRGTLRVVEFSTVERRLATVLQVGVTVPAEGRERLMGIVSDLTGEVDVHSDVLLGHLETEDADATLRLQMLPDGPGLVVEARVRPMGEGGPALLPGQGAASTVRTNETGDQVQVVRDLDGERRRVDELPARCATLASAAGRPDEAWWALPDPGQCLAFLEEVEGAEDVILEWPQGRRFSVRRGTFSGPVVTSSQADWFSVEADFIVDDGRVLSLRQLLDLLDHASGRFVPLGDDAFLALTDEFRRRLDDLAGYSEGRGCGVRFHRIAAAAVDDSLSELMPSSGEARPWCEWVKRLEAPVEAEVPRGLEAELRDYQVEGFRWLARLAAMGLGACLADDMGLGKTVQALALLLNRAGGGPALVVAPTSVCANWLDEALRFAPALEMRLYAGPGRARELEGLGPCQVVVTSYSLLQQDVEALTAIQWHSVVLDEAQAIKNHQTQRAKAAVALSADFRLITTGTPVENHLLELWSLFGFLNPGLLGPRARFTERFALPVERDGDRAARARLKRLVAPFILRRTKAMVLDELPPRTDITRHVELGADERALYEALRQRAVEVLEGSEVESGEGRIRVLAELMRLRRACCHPRLVLPDSDIPSGRLEALAEIVDELRENHHRALVFSQFVDHLSLVREHLDARGIPYEYLDGSTPMAERARRVEAFQAGRGDLFLISLRAGGTGLNLTAADYVIHLDPWWNPAVEDQASDRVHRIGQQRPVTVYRLVARGTVEEKIVELHRHKRDLADSLLEGTDAAARLSGEDLLLLLRA